MDIAYFDNAATTYIKAPGMHDFMHEFYQCNSVNVNRGSHIALARGAKMVEDTRKRLKKLFNANSEYEAILTPTATEAINIILQGQDWQEGDVVYISPFEHNAVYRVLNYLSQKHKLIVEELALDKKTLDFDFEKIRYQFSQKKPDFIATTHASNVFGCVLNINELGRLVAQYNCRVLVDCAQTAGLLETDIIKTYADYMVFAGHKTLYGPFGCSGFICKKQSAPSPLLYGGTGVDSLSPEMPDALPLRLEAGSQNILSIAGLNYSLKWVEEIDLNAINEKKKEATNSLFDVLKNASFFKMLGYNESANIGIISCVTKEISPESFSKILERYGVIVRAGLQCSPLAHKYMNTLPEGTLRFSVSYFTSEEDIEILSRALNDIENEL